VSVEDAAPPWPERRFSQAISEGDGISLIPLLHGRAHTLSAPAEAAGAEALAVETIEDLGLLRAGTELPLLLRGAVGDVESLRAAREAGADACILVWGDLDDENLELLVGEADALGLDWGIEVRDEDELAQALERLDPEILVLCGGRQDEDEGDELELTLDLLPDVPAGKLVVSDARLTTREEVLDLEQAGVDAVLLAGGFSDPERLEAALVELTGRV
jgi:indole-3-glycerol phosphate synthase